MKKLILLFSVLAGFMLGSTITSYSQTIHISSCNNIVVNDQMTNFCVSLEKQIGKSIWKKINQKCYSDKVFFFDLEKGTYRCKLQSGEEIPMTSNSVTISDCNNDLSNNTFIAFPSPTTNSFKLIVAESISDNNELLVYNSMGKVVFRKPKISENFEVKTNDWEEGVYFLNLVDYLNSNSSFAKLIVQK